MHPFLIKIGWFTLPSYGVMIMIGVILCVWLALRRARSVGINPDDVYDLAFFALLSGFIGARLLYVIVNFREFLEHPGAMIFSRSGFVFLGGLLGAIPVVFYVIRSKKLPKWEIADIAAPSLSVAHAFGRIGCFLAGCCYGGVCPKDSPLAFLGVQFPVFRDATGEVEYSMSYDDHLRHGLIDRMADHTAAVYPSQLFESTANLIILSLLLLAWRRRKFQGQIFSLYLAFYGTARFMLEYARGDIERGVWFGLSTSQWISIGLVLAAGVIWFMRMNAPFESVPPRPETPPAPVARTKSARQKTARR